jgi:Antitoxin of toxin-antitoxin, RelE / RelB, TA system
MSNHESAVNPLNLSDVRERLSDVFTDAVVRHRPVPIARSEKDLGILLGLEEVARLVEGISFEPEVFKEDETVNVWLPQFQVYGRGKDLAAARLELLDEVRDYVVEYLEEIDSYRAAPNRRAHFPHVIKAMAADLSGHLDSAIFSDRPTTQAEEGLPAPRVR